MTGPDGATALFEPLQLGPVRLANRFVRSATYESMATADGAVTPALVKLYRTLGKGQIGAIISGVAYVSPEGRNANLAIGLDRDERVAGLRELAGAAKEHGSALFVQLVHAGGQTARRVIGRRPLAPSAHLRDPLYFEKPLALSEPDILRIIDAFGQAAARAMEAGADGVQLHGAHGYLIAQFLSPFFNRRSDEWGGSRSRRFRFLREVIQSVRGHAGDEVPIWVKIVHDDGTPRPGMTAELAADVASRLAALDIAGVELSVGGTCWAPFRMCRGEVPVDELSRIYPWPLRPVMRRKFRSMATAATFSPSYNAHAAQRVKQALGKVPLLLVGGLRSLAEMDEVVRTGRAELVSLSRPFVRHPHLVRRFLAGKDEQAACTSCNRCLAAAFNQLPLRCYRRGLPTR